MQVQQPYDDVCHAPWPRGDAQCRCNACMAMPPPSIADAALDKAEKALGMTDATLQKTSMVQDDWMDEFLTMPPPPPPRLMRQNAVLSIDELEMPKTMTAPTDAMRGMRPMRPMQMPSRTRDRTMWPMRSTRLNPP